MRISRWHTFLVLFTLLGCIEFDGLPPEPPLRGLESDVATHLKQTYETLREANSTQKGSTLGKAFGDAGMTYHAYDLSMMAKACYLRARELNHEDRRWIYLLAQVNIELGNLERAQTALSSLVYREPDNLPARVAYGEIQAKLNQVDFAKDIFRRILKDHPQCAPALAALGKIALKEGNAELARIRLEEALNLSPGSSGLRYPYGLALRELGETELALKQMEARGDAFPRVNDPWLEEVRNRPVGARIPLNRGITFFQEGYYEKAQEQFKIAVESSPESASAHLNLGSALVKLKKPMLAIKEFNEAIRLDPDSTMSWFNLGVIYAALKEDLEAIHCYDQALLIEPRMPEGLFNRANALRRLKRYQQAAQEMRKVRELRPGNTLAWLAESVCFYRIDDEAEALRVCREGRLATANEPRLVSLESRILATQNPVSVDALNSSLVEIDQLLDKEKALEFVETKAMLLAALGNFQEALQWQEAALQAARNAGEKLIVERLRTNKNHYSRGERARDPWPESDSVADPEPPSGSSSPGESDADETQDTSQ